jgi:hypothetical protein
MRLRSKAALCGMLSIAIAAGAPAQTPAPAAGQCADSVGPAAYVRCALWLDGTRVRRGSDASVVAQPRFFGPARLVRVVVGDSARTYASRYEKNARRSYLFGALSGALLGAAWIVAKSYDCAPGIFGYCTNSDDNYGIASGGLAIGSAVALLASIPFTVRATRAMGRAVWWHNARFAR